MFEVFWCDFRVCRCFGICFGVCCGFAVMFVLFVYCIDFAVAGCLCTPYPGFYFLGAVLGRCVGFRLLVCFRVLQVAYLWFSYCLCYACLDFAYWFCRFWCFCCSGFWFFGVLLFCSILLFEFDVIWLFHVAFLVFCYLPLRFGFLLLWLVDCALMLLLSCWVWFIYGRCCCVFLCCV